MEDLLRALMQGGRQQSRPGDAGHDNDPLAQLLQGLTGGQTNQEPAGQAESAPAQGSADLGGLLQDILGNTGSLPSGTDHIPEGHGLQAEAGPVQDSADLGGLLQGILGGTGGLSSGTGQASTGSASGLSDVLGAIMGGGSSALQSSSFLAPIVTGLAEKLGLPPQIAQAVVAFVLGKLVGSRLQPEMETGPDSVRSGAVLAQAPSLEDVVQRMNSGKKVTKAQIRSAGLAKELSAHTGLNRATAEASLQQVVNALGGQLAAGK